MFGSSNVHIRTEFMNLRSGLENLNIIHISDLHIPFANKRLSTIVKHIEEINPELVFLTGDYIDFASSIGKFESLIHQICEKRTLIYVTGNHDRRFKTIIEETMGQIPNCHNVDDDIYVYTSKNNFKYLISSWETKDEIESNENLKQIVLIHNPRSIDVQNIHNISLIFAGHLHGGQFVLRKLKNGDLFPGNLFYKYCFESKMINKTKIIVSKGLGDVFPFRLNCPYELINMKIN